MISNVSGPTKNIEIHRSSSFGPCVIQEIDSILLARDWSVDFIGRGSRTPFSRPFIIPLVNAEPSFLILLLNPLHTMTILLHLALPTMLLVVFAATALGA
jgi:hypothetical protein